jgi:hypothetical protein
MYMFQYRDRLKHDQLKACISAGGTQHTMLIPKGYVTLAAKETTCCKLATSGNYEMFLENNGSVFEFKLTDNNAQRVVCTAKVDGMIVEETHDPLVKVKGMRAMALHIKKKSLAIPDSDVMLSELPPYHDREVAESTIRHMQYDLACLQSRADQHTYYLNDVFREVSHFNTKLVSIISATYPSYDLRQCQGVCLNVCASYATPHRAETAILAHTLEPVRLPGAVISALQQAAAERKAIQTASFLRDATSKAVTSMGVYRVPATLRMELASAGVCARETSSSRMYFALSQYKIPILIVDVCQERVNQILGTQGDVETLLADESFAGAMERLRYIQAAADYHCFARNVVNEITQAWAFGETARHPDQKNNIIALSSLQTTSVPSHVAWYR